MMDEQSKKDKLIDFALTWLLPGLFGSGVLIFVLIPYFFTVSEWYENFIILPVGFVLSVTMFFAGMGIVFGGLFYLVRGTIKSTDGWSWGEFFQGIMMGWIAPYGIYLLFFRFTENSIPLNLGIITGFLLIFLGVLGYDDPCFTAGGTRTGYC